MTPRTSRNRALLVVWLVWLCSLLGLLSAARGDADAYSWRVASARMLGYHALVALSASLCVTPLQRVYSRFGLRLARSSQLRRALGLSALVSAALHSGVGFWSSPLELRAQWDDSQLRFGAVALVILALLGATSFSTLVHKLRLRSWKELHRLAYVAWACAVVHGLLSPYAWLLGLLVGALAVLAFGLLRLLPSRAPASE